MGKRSKKQKQHPHTKSRKLDAKGNLKRKRGDPKKQFEKYSTRFKIRKMKKHGKRVAGERVCNLHTFCDCLEKTDNSKTTFITNMPLGKRNRIRNKDDDMPFY